MISAIVMAAGLSRRMGRNKLLFKIKDKTLIEGVLDAVSAVNFTEKLLVSKNDEIISLGREYGFSIVYNDNPEIGQSGSVRLGVLNSDENAAYMFFVGDQPFITALHIETIIKEYNKCPDKIAVPMHKGKKGNPVIFPNRFRSELLNLRQDKGGRGIIEDNAQHINLIEFGDEKVFFDVDTPTDYETVKKLLT